jgi:hypothetical protein
LASPGGKDGADPAADEMAVFRGSVATWRMVDDVVDALPIEEGTKAAHPFRLDARRTVTVLADNLIFIWARMSVLDEDAIGKWSVGCDGGRSWCLMGDGGGMGWMEQEEDSFVWLAQRCL